MSELACPTGLYIPTIFPVLLFFFLVFLFVMLFG